MNRKEIIEKLQQPFCFGLLKRTDPELAVEVVAIGVKEFEVWDRNDISKPEWCDGDERLSFDERCTYRLKPYYIEPVLGLKSGEWAGERHDKEADLQYWYQCPNSEIDIAYKMNGRKDFIDWMYDNGTRTRDFGLWDAKANCYVFPTHAIFKKGGE